MDGRFFLGRRHRREPERAHRRRGLARSGRAARRCSRRRSRCSDSSGRAATRRHRGELLRRRAGPALHAAGRAARASPSRPRSRSPPSWPAARATRSSTLRRTASRSRSSSPPAARASRSTARSRAAGPRRRTRARRPPARCWPNAAVGGDLSYELPLPRHFEQATEDVTPEDLKEALPLRPGPGSLARGSPGVRAGRLHAHLLPPDRPRPGRLPEVLAEELEPRL